MNASTVEARHRVYPGGLPAYARLRASPETNSKSDLQPAKVVQKPDFHRGKPGGGQRSLR
jgi:hypothetical protein